MLRGISERASGFAKNAILRSSRFHGDSSVSPVLIPGVHVFHCQDAVGIVAKLSDCIAAKGGNILGYDVFVPENNNVILLPKGLGGTSGRTEVAGKPLICDENKTVSLDSEFIFDPVKWPRNQVDEDFQTIAQTFGAMNSVVRVPSIDPKYKIALLLSKQDHCLVEMLHRWQDGKLPVDISCVISNHERASNTHVMRFLERHGIPYHYVLTSKENKREDEILKLVKDTDFLVLARYMQVLSGNFLKGYGKDVINIHHGLLPSFKDGNPAKQAFDAGVKLIGATSHFVTEELDSGPIIEQMVESISHRDNLGSFVQKSEDLEKKCLTKAIKSYCELRVLPYGTNKTVVF